MRSIVHSWVELRCPRGVLFGIKRLGNQRGPLPFSRHWWPRVIPDTIFCMPSRRSRGRPFWSSHGIVSHTRRRWTNISWARNRRCGGILVVAMSPTRRRGRRLWCCVVRRDHIHILGVASSIRSILNLRRILRMGVRRRMRIRPPFIKRARKSVRNSIRTPVVIIRRITIRSRSLKVRRRAATHSTGSHRMRVPKYLLVHY